MLLYFDSACLIGEEGNCEEDSDFYIEFPKNYEVERQLENFDRHFLSRNTDDVKTGTFRENNFYWKDPLQNEKNPEKIHTYLIQLFYFSSLED